MTPNDNTDPDKPPGWVGWPGEILVTVAWVCGALLMWWLIFESWGKAPK